MPTLLEVCDPASQADHDALAALVDASGECDHDHDPDSCLADSCAECDRRQQSWEKIAEPSTPADHLAGDWLGAIVSDLEPSADEQRALDHVEAMVLFGDVLLRHAIGRASITWLDGDARRLWTLWNLSQA